MGGIFTHFWVTGGNKTWIDNAIVSFYVDNEARPSIQFQVNMGGGTGFVDDISNCTLGNCPEKNSPWGNDYIGKGSGMGGWYFNLKIPFSNSFKATIKSYLDCVTYSNFSTMTGIDFYGSNLNSTQSINYNNNNTIGNNGSDCYQLCKSTTNCRYWTLDTVSNECLLKSSNAAAGMINTIPSIISGDVYNKVLCEEYEPEDPSVFVIVRGVYDLYDSNMNINIGNGYNIPKNATMISISNYDYLNPLEYYNIFQIILNSNANAKFKLTSQMKTKIAKNKNKDKKEKEKEKQKQLLRKDNIGIYTNGLYFMSTLSVVTETMNFLEGCFHLYNPLNESFPGMIMATGTEDYYNSGYYFLNSYPMHLPTVGYTWYETFNSDSNNPVGPFTNGGIKWSAYRLHTMDPVLFSMNGNNYYTDRDGVQSDGCKLVWRNGDVADNGVGKCRHQGNGTAVGSPSNSYVRSLAFVYLW